MKQREYYNLKPFQRRAIKHVNADVDTMLRDGWRIMFKSVSQEMYFVKLKHQTNGHYYSVRAYYKPVLGQPNDVVIYHNRDGIVVKTEILSAKTPQHHDTALY